MVGRGARNLVLLGRSGAGSLEAREAVAAMERQGVRVLVARADVTSGATRWPASWPTPPRPCRRCAAWCARPGSLMTGCFNSSPGTRWKRSWPPRCSGPGTCTPRRCGARLDFFILYSSATTFLACGAGQLRGG